MTNPGASPPLPPQPPRSPALSAVTMTMLMQPEHSNSLGNVHGGVILKLCDEAGGIVASRHARRPAVTVTVDTVHFLRPVLVGHLVLVHGCITWVGRTSVEVELLVETENLITGERVQTNRAYFVYVALDEHRRPTPVPGLLLATEEEQRRYEEGKQRHERRLREAGRA